MQGDKVTGDLHAVATDKPTAPGGEVASMDAQMAEYMILCTAPAMLELLERELNFLEPVAQPKQEPQVRADSRARELCDVCLTGIFNLRCAGMCSRTAGRRAVSVFLILAGVCSWICKSCGFVVCLDCRSTPLPFHSRACMRVINRR